MRVDKKKRQRSTLIGPTDQRKRFLAISQQMRAGTPISEDQVTYLADRFEKIGNGGSADQVFNLKYSRGKKQKDEIARQRMSLIFQMVASKISPVDGPFPGEGMRLDEAISEIVPLAQEIFGVNSGYDFDYLRRLWFDPSYKHMRSPFRTPLDPDSPFPLLRDPRNTK